MFIPNDTWARAMEVPANDSPATTVSNARNFNVRMKCTSLF